MVGVSPSVSSRSGNLAWILLMLSNICCAMASADCVIRSCEGAQMVWGKCAESRVSGSGANCVGDADGWLAKVIGLSLSVGEEGCAFGFS